MKAYKISFKAHTVGNLERTQLESVVDFIRNHTALPKMPVYVVEALWSSNEAAGLFQVLYHSCKPNIQ